MAWNRRVSRITGLLIVSALAVCSILWAARPGGLSPHPLKVFWQELPVPGERAFQSPLPSPDGRYLALTTEKSRGLWLFDLKKRSIKRISNQAGAGFRARWAPKKAIIAYRVSPGGPRPKHEIIVAHPDGVKGVASTLERNLSLPLWRGRRVVFFTWGKDGPRMRSAGADEAENRQIAVPFCDPRGNIWMGGSGKSATRFAADPGKVFFLPVLSADGEKFVVECLDGHIYLGRTSGGDLLDLGPGSYPSFVKNDSAILFERTRDDGNVITSSALYLLTLDSMKPQRFSDIPGVIERRPSMAEDGRTVYCDADGKIFMGVMP